MGAKSSYLNTSYCDFHAFNTPAKIIYVKKKKVCVISSPRAVNYGTRLNGMPGCVPERRIGKQQTDK